MAQFYENQTEQEKVILVAVYEKGGFQDEESLRELEELTKTAGAVCVGTVTQNLESENPVTYLGKGKLEELRTMLVAYHATGADEELVADVRYQGYGSNHDHIGYLCSKGKYQRG